MNDFERMLEAVGGKQGIIDCIRAGNDAPLELVIEAARAEIANRLKGK